MSAASSSCEADACVLLLANGNDDERENVKRHGGTGEDVCVCMWRRTGVGITKNDRGSWWLYESIWFVCVVCVRRRVVGGWIMRMRRGGER